MNLLKYHLTLGCFPGRALPYLALFLNKQSMIFRELGINEHTISFTIQNFKHLAIWVGNFKRV